MKKLIVLISSLILTACAGTQFNWDNARKIKTGMSESEVLSIMGKPNAVRSDANGLTYAWTSVNGLTGTVKTVTTVVKDGKVVSAPTIPDSY